MPSIREKACKYYRDQDLRLLQVKTPESALQPTFVEALIRGYLATYLVRLEDGQWTCTGDEDKSDCPHRAAVQMATGHPSAAAKAGAR